MPEKQIFSHLTGCGRNSYPAGHTIWSMEWILLEQTIAGVGALSLIEFFPDALCPMPYACFKPVFS
jgi:hypothetical protein